MGLWAPFPFILLTVEGQFELLEFFLEVVIDFGEQLLPGRETEVFLYLLLVLKDRSLVCLLLNIIHLPLLLDTRHLIS